jgi:hypothetical protein
MVTRDQIWNQLGKRPFQPFRVTLTTGKKIEIFRPNQAIVTPRQFIVALGRRELFNWIPLDRIERLDVHKKARA